jgi:alpha-N-arabinofuranosidase
MNMIKLSRQITKYAAVLALVARFPAGAALAQENRANSPVVLKIKTDKAIGKVSPTLYGLMTEEINYSYDGGLFAELIRNRTFRNSWMGAEHWQLVQNGKAKATIQEDRTTGPSTALNYSMKLSVEEADAQNRAGLENEGYWGIAVRPGTEYKCYFYAKAGSAASGPVTVQLVNDDTGKIAAQALTAPLTDGWKKYEVVLKTSPAINTSTANHFVLSVAKPGDVWFSLVSLFPPTYKNRGNGNRIDIMEKLAAMKPAFLRLPGGNYLEGDTIAERFDWKKTIGDPVDRPTHRSPWNYQSSDGMGLLEFLGWCEDLGIQPVLAVYAGFSLKGEYVKPGADLEPYVQEALDEIEYVGGGTNTKWGAERAKNGHSAPFALHYVEIGNEDQFDKSGSYDARYAQFYKAIKAKYPELQIIATDQITSMKPDVMDDHYYKRKEEFFADVAHYDKTDRNGPKIFVGEWATLEGAPTPNFGAALGDAAWMTGMERNSDIIILSSYAPLLVNVNPGGPQWGTNLIGYDALTSYASPSYYAQVMFSTHLGDEIVESTISGNGPRLFYSVTRDSKNEKLFLKIVNASSDPQEIEIDLQGAGKVKRDAAVITLRANTNEETNTITNPKRIVPVQTKLNNAADKFRHTAPSYSIQVLEIETR